MSSDNHTPIPYEADATSAVFNAPLSELDEAINTNAADIATNAGDIDTLEAAATDSVHVNVDGEINGVTSKATPATADVLLIEDSAASFAKKKATISQVAAVLPNVIHSNKNDEFGGAASKTTPIDTDLLLIEDSASFNAKKRITVRALRGHGARVFRTTNQSIPNATLTPIQFDNEEFDYGGLHDNVTNNSRITIVEAGVYLIFGRVVWEYNTTGQREVRLLVNAGSKDYDVRSASTVATNTVGTVTYLNAADYVTMQVQQDSGGALNLLGQTYVPSLSVQRIG